MKDERFCNQCRRMHKPRKCFVGKNVEIHPTVEINVTEELFIDDGCIILANAKIEGRSIKLGKECFLHEYSWLGGGGCFEKSASLSVGHWLHLGRFGHINFADAVKIGDQVGIGHQSSIWTHGGYLPVDKYFPHTVAPTTIGDNVWLPHAWVNPGVNIGNNVIVAAMSLVNKNIPNYCFAAGIPAKVKRTNYSISDSRPTFDYIVNWLMKHDCHVNSYNKQILSIRVNGAEFLIGIRQIIGQVSDKSRRAKDILRRIGIRFPYKEKDGRYVPWDQ